jgi:glycosyltransferase involved in cell wall biosynthesis
VTVAHFSYASSGGAARAARRTSLACEAAGLNSVHVFVSGDSKHDGDICLSLETTQGDNRAQTLDHVLERIQWDFIPRRRTDVSNTLLSTAYPGVDVTRHPVFAAADIIHLHWPTWGITPTTLAQWLETGRTIFWTLHDCWPLTGGCHYPAGCEQYKTRCMKCPQLQNDYGLIANGFAEKLKAYQNRGSLSVITPSNWLANVARDSAIFRHRTVNVVRNPLELDLFAPRADRMKLRSAFGVQPDDFVILFGSHDLNEQRKGVRSLFEAVRELATAGELAAALPRGARIHLAVVGGSPELDELPGATPLHFGQVDEDGVLADILAIADVTCVPSLEDNYPNVIIESLACGTPCIVTPVGGMPEMITDGDTGVVVPEAGCVEALKHSVVKFARHYLGSLEMRERCRAATVLANHPEIIGAQLKELYEQALDRPLCEPEKTIHSRMLKAFARCPVRRDAVPSREFFRFPANVALLNRFPQSDTVERFNAKPLQPQTGKQRLLTVRTYHEHHSSHSGPYQFLRRLPDGEYEGTHLAVPLGREFAGDMAPLYRKSGAMLGVRSFGQQANAWLAEAEVLIQCAAEKIDLVHFIDGELTGWLVPMAPPAIFKEGVRPVLLATFHQPPSVLKGMINAELLESFDGVIALCDTQREFLQRYVGPRRVFLIPHGVDTQFFHPPSADFLPPAGDALRLLLVGHWLRDLGTAFAAIKLIVDSGLKVDLTVISPRFPATTRDCVCVVRSGISDEALREAYWSADLLFLPLIDATANNAVLEAMACGLAVVSTDVGGVKEAVRDDAGLLCPPGDARALADAVIKLARDPERRRGMGHAGSKRAQTLDWSVIGAMHHQAYRTLLGLKLSDAMSPAMTSVRAA